MVRTDFSDYEAWTAIGVAVHEPTDEGFRAFVDLLDDEAFRNLTTAQLLDRIPVDYRQKFLLVVDDVAISGQHHPILVVDLLDEPGRTFRAVPATVQSIQDNLTLGNMSFSDFAASAGKDGG